MSRIQQLIEWKFNLNYRESWETYKRRPIELNIYWTGKDPNIQSFITCVNMYIYDYEVAQFTFY